MLKNLIEEARSLLTEKGSLSEAKPLWPLPTSPDDWQLYTDMPGVKKAATALASALKKAEAKLRTQLKGLDPQDHATVATTLYAPYKEFVVPVMRKYAEFGADDTEPHYVAKEYLDRVAQSLGFEGNHDF